MAKTILVAGASGNLGNQIINALIEFGADVRAIVRNETNADKVADLRKRGVHVFLVNMQSVDEIAKACEGVDCVVSALSGLRDVIIDTQKVLLDAAVKAGVPRFIPSDYSIDFTPFEPGANRNLDWRREFKQYLDKAPIKATSVFIGAFADMLTGEMPVILFKQKRILCWGNADHKIIYTTIHDTAVYTAHVALDASTPRFLHIASSQLSSHEMAVLVSRISGQKFSVFRPGGAGLLSIIIKIARFISPGKNELYPAWQGMQYMRYMIDERSNLKSTDNNRYPDMRWTSVEELLMANTDKFSGS